MTSSNTLKSAVSNWELRCINRGKPSRYWWATRGRCDELSYISKTFKTKKEADAFIAETERADSLRTPPTPKGAGIRAGELL